MQALYLLALDPIAEVINDPNSYGFRQERSPADAIEQCFSVLSRQNCAQWILEGDIKSCFDQISHEWLLTHIPMEKTILKNWLKAGFIDKYVLHTTEEGTPQGGICSPVLANMALNGLEKELREKFPKHPHGGSNEKINFVRFADDFIVTGQSKVKWSPLSSQKQEQFLGGFSLDWKRMSLSLFQSNRQHCFCCRSRWRIRSSSEGETRVKGVQRT